MGVKLIELERAMLAEEFLKDAMPNATRKERAIVALRLEYFDRVGVRLHYQARDMSKYGDDPGKRKEFCDLSCDILALASLIHPYHRVAIEPDENIPPSLDQGEKHVRWAIGNLFALYKAAEALLAGDHDRAASMIEAVKGGARPADWGAKYSNRFDKQLKGLMEASVSK
jgi:hypothetical protein